MTTKDVIYLGTFADADTDEGSFALENSSVYLQNFGSAGAPISDDLEQVTFNDADSNGSIETDNVGTSDTVVTVAGTVQVDSLVTVDATVTYSDNSTASFSDVVMFQTTDGDLFLANSDYAGTDIRPSGGLTLQSINVTAITGEGYTGLYHQNFQSFACYVHGTELSTISGSQPIETIRPGDQVLTRDRGYQEVKWVGLSEVFCLANLCPIRIRKDALGDGVPSRDLLVSKQHRMLINSKIVKRMIGEDEGFVSAHKLLPLEGVELAQGMLLTRYYHLMCERHEVIFANGAPSETLLPDIEALKMLDHEQYCEVIELFPEKSTPNQIRSPARPIFTGAKQKRLVQRHIANKKPIVGPRYTGETVMFG